MKKTELHRARFGILAAALLALALPSAAQNKPAPPQSYPDPARRLADQLAASFDAGDFYQTPQGRRSLRRLAGVIAVQFAATNAANILAPPPGYALEAKTWGGTHLFKAAPAEQERQRLRPAAFNAALAAARTAPGVRCANPVFVDLESGLRQVPTEQIVLKLKPGVSAQKYFGAVWPRVRPLFGTTDQFVLTLPGATAESVLGAVNRHAARAEVVWAEPDFVSEVVKLYTPSDPAYTNQWHLRNDGQFGGKPGADAKLNDAWDVTNGSPEIVVAVFDDGVELNHPDLMANRFVNQSEVAETPAAIEGHDDDGNGFVDDYYGWDFVNDDNDPSPDASDDGHGTCVAGVIAAAGENGAGGVGAAFGGRFLAVKIITGEYEVPVSKLATALRYAAGLGADGRTVWRGADVFNLSVRFNTGAVVDSALHDAATKGRNGRGCPIFCSAGNGASGWLPERTTIDFDGEHTLRWEFHKDGSDFYNPHANTVWLDAVKFPDGAIESFEGAGLPPGWRTGGPAPWSRVPAGVNGNHAVTGLNGPRAHALRAGSIGHNQTTWLELTTNLNAGEFSFWFWISSEGSPVRLYDPLRFYVDGEDRLAIAGQYPIKTGVGYPASHPATIAVGASTDLDYRADYSQYAAKLDFVAPSFGGRAGIFTTDRSGFYGYNRADGPDGDYFADFGGTSAASPLAAGLGALVLSVNPSLTVAEVRSVLRSTCDKIGGVAYDAAGRHATYGSGRLNAARAVRAAQADVGLRVALTPAIANLGCPTTYVLTVTNKSALPAWNLAVTNQLPANVLFASAKPAPAFHEGNLLVFSLSNLNPRASATFRITVTNVALGAIENVAAVSLPVVDWNPADNSVKTDSFVRPVPAISITDASVVEGNTAATNLLFIVALANPSGKPVTVRYATATNTALAGADFVPASGTLIFAPGQTTKTITVRVNGDLRHEWDETFFVNLTNPVNATLDRAQAVGTILDNDLPPQLSVADAAVTEGNVGALNAVFPVRLSAASGRVVTVYYLTLPGSATEGGDFSGRNGQLTFPPGVAQQFITLPVLGDALRESNETFTVQLLDPINATLGRAQATGVIRNDDPLPKLFLSDAAVLERDGDATNALFLVRLSPAGGLPVSVNYFTTNGTARAGLDYADASGTLIFALGETNQFITVPVLGDTLSESNETFLVKLFSPTNAALGDALGAGSIVDNDPLPALSIDDVTVAEPASGTTNAIFTVSLSGPSGRPVSVRYATSNGTATAGQDFTARAGTLTFAPGATARTVSVVVRSDALIELEQDFFVNLSAPVNATLDDAQGRGNIGFDFLIVAGVRLADGQVRLSFPTAAGGRYGVECCDELGGADGWRPVPGAENIAGTGTLVEVTDAAPATKPQCFYRVRRLTR